MARHPKRQLVEARVKYLYERYQDLPWSKIETAVDKQFSESERSQIYLCTNEYSEEFSCHTGAAKMADVTKLREEILKSLDPICELAERFQPLGIVEIDLEDRKAMDALSQMLSDGKLNLGVQFHSVAAAANNLAARLRAKTTFEPDVTSRSPELIALDSFVERALSFADEKPARREGTAKNRGSGTKEYSKWGIPVGPKSIKFKSFVNAVLREQFTQDQIKTAFKHVREKVAPD